MSCLTCANAKAPNTLQLEKFVGIPLQIAISVLDSRADDGHLFIRYTVIFTASPQKILGKHAPKSMHLTRSKMLLFILLARPFCYGVPATILCLLIPNFLQNSLNCFERNSNLLLILKTFSMIPH